MANPSEALSADFNPTTQRSFPRRMSAGPPAPGQTAKQSAGSVSINTGATVTLNTVTTGKTYYITDIHLATDQTLSVDAKIQAAGVTIFESFIISSAPCDMAGLETQPFATSGQVVTLLLPTVAGKNVNYFVSGYEE